MENHRQQTKSDHNDDKAQLKKEESSHQTEEGKRKHGGSPEAPKSEEMD